MGFHRAASIEAGTRVANGVGIGATKASKRSRCPLMPPLKFITTKASQGGVIALTTTQFTRQHNIVRVSQGAACRQILWSDGPWTSGEIEPTLENYYESQGYKSTTI